MGRIIDADELLRKQYKINDSATLSSRDVVNVEDIEDSPTVEAVPMEKINEILDGFSRWLWIMSEDIRGDNMIDIDYAEKHLRELFDWERKWEE